MGRGRPPRRRLRVVAIRRGGAFDFVYHLGAYAAEGLSHFIRGYNYRTNLEASVNLINNAVLGGVQRFVFTSSIAVYGAGQMPMREDMTPTPGGSLRDLEVRGGARPHGRSAHVRSRLHDLPAPQRVRRAPEHRRPLPQRHRHLHEQRHAGSADADLRRRPADPCVLPHRRRGARSSRGRRWSRRPATRCSTSAPTRPTRSSTSRDDDRDRLRRGGRRPASRGAQRGRRTRSPITRRCGACSAPGEPLSLHEGIARMAQWARDHGPCSPLEFPGKIEVATNLPPSWRAALSPAS